MPTHHDTAGERDLLRPQRHSGHAFRSSRQHKRTVRATHFTACSLCLSASFDLRPTGLEQEYTPSPPSRPAKKPHRNRLNSTWGHRERSPMSKTSRWEVDVCGAQFSRPDAMRRVSPIWTRSADEDRVGAERSSSTSRNTALRSRGTTVSTRAPTRDRSAPAAAWPPAR